MTKRAWVTVVAVLLGSAMVFAALPATDTFTGMNSDPLSGNWTTDNGAWNIWSGQANSTTADSLARWTADSFSSDHYAEVTISTSGGNHSGGPVVRGTSTTGYAVTYNSAYDELDLARIDSITTPTYVLLQNITGLSLSNNDALRLEVSGTTLKVYVEGMQVGTDETDATYSSGSAGILNRATGVQLDNFEADDLAASTGVPQDLLLLGVGR